MSDNRVLHCAHDKIASRRNPSPDDADSQIHDVHDSGQSNAEQVPGFYKNLPGELVPFVRGL